MIVVSITNAKIDFYELFRRAKNGEAVTITKWGKPVARLVKSRK